MALRTSADRVYAKADVLIFGRDGVAGLLTDEANIERRNRAAHDTVLTRDNALQARTWALEILERL